MTIEFKAITNLFTDGPLTGTQLIEGIFNLTGCKSGDIPNSPPIGHFGNDIFGDAITLTKTFGLKIRLPETFPEGVEVVQVYYGDNPSEYVGLINEGGKYDLWSPHPANPPRPANSKYWMPPKK